MMAKDIASRAEAAQIAALPLQWQKDGGVRVLMVTSRDTRRWIMPKGWTMNGKKPWAAAKIEALEEAGALGDISQHPIGIYHYDKVLEDGTALTCEVTVYPMRVETLSRTWKERHQRKRRWFSPKAAAKRVQEPELAALLLSLSDKPRKKDVLRTARAGAAPVSPKAPPRPA